MCHYKKTTPLNPEESVNIESIKYKKTDETSFDDIENMVK